MNLQELKKLCVLSNINIYFVQIGTICKKGDITKGQNVENIYTPYSTLKNVIVTSKTSYESDGVKELKQIGFNTLESDKPKIAYEKYVIWSGKEFDTKGNPTFSAEKAIELIKDKGLVICTCNNPLIIKAYNEKQILAQKKPLDGKYGLSFELFNIKEELNNKANQYEALFLGVQDFISKYIDISQS